MTVEALRPVARAVKFVWPMMIGLVFSSAIIVSPGGGVFGVNSPGVARGLFVAASLCSFAKPLALPRPPIVIACSAVVVLAVIGRAVTIADQGLTIIDQVGWWDGRAVLLGLTVWSAIGVAEVLFTLGLLALPVLEEFVRSHRLTQDVGRVR